MHEKKEREVKVKKKVKKEKKKIIGKVEKIKKKS
jgi:hypothetical protein